MAAPSSSSPSSSPVRVPASAPASKTRCHFSTLAPVYSSVSLKVLVAFLEGMGLEISPSWPIICSPFKFLKSLDLTSVGLGLDDVPFDFGWKLILWEPGRGNNESTNVAGVFGFDMNMFDELMESISSLGDEDFSMAEAETGSEPVSAGDMPGTGPEPVPEISERPTDTSPTFDDIMDVSEKVADLGWDTAPFTEKTPPSPKRSNLPCEGSQKKRVKKPAGRTDLPFTRKALATQTSEKSSTSRPKSAPKPTRKSSRIATQTAQSSHRQGRKRGPPVIEEISSSSDESSHDSAANTPEKQGPAESSPELTLSALRKSLPKRKLPSPEASPAHSPPKPAAKRAKKSTPSVPSAKLAQLLQRSVVRGKILKIAYFEKQGLRVFLDKLNSQGWLDLFTNTQLGCSVPDLAEFYANCSINQGTVTSKVQGKKISFDAKKLGEILGVPATGFDVYVREDKSVLGTTRLLELSQKLSQKPTLQAPQTVKKGDMTSLHQLLFWFTIKNVIPRGQRRNAADAMDQCIIDLLDKEEQINFPALMIRHISRIANTAREHDLGYGFLLTFVLESFGVVLQKKVGVQAVDEIGSSTLLGCGFPLGEGEASEQGLRTPLPPVPASTSATTSIESVINEQAKLKSDLSEVKEALTEEKALNAKRHEDLLTLLSTLSAKLTPPPP